ncbi:MAG: aspartate-semialdehyde dehydrogenase [Gemmatimonadaceae bacterium]|nr:aspartate-semialdehyde dehydrogenase [Gemmatimonadaceae bacterium]
MFGGQARVPIVVRQPTGLWMNCAAQHSQSLEAWWAHMPGLVVLAPATPADSYAMIKAAIRADDPVILLEHKELWGVAGEVEQAFARAGRFVLSNAKNHRMDPDVPLVIPEVNAPHLGLLDRQREQRAWTGGIVTNANCAATVAAVAMAPLHEAFGIDRAMVFTMQAVSGAGYPGVPSLDILGNVIPYISEEEAKVERELDKMLGRFDGRAIAPAGVAVSAHTNRVPAEHGHMVCLSLGFRRRVTPDEALAAMDAWRGHPEALGLPSSPDRALVVTREPDRPQTRRDVGAGSGMTVTAGRVRPDPLFDLRLVALGHNTIRGAAGGSILNAELLARHGLLPAA